MDPPASLVCMFCKETTRAPKTLPCSHSFCATCFQNHFGKGQDREPCPVCGQAAKLPSGGVDALPSSSLFLADMAKQTHERTTIDIKCEFCEEKGATAHCQDCQQFSCVGCEKIHLRAKPMAHHKFLSVDEALKRGSDLATRPSFCALHPSHELDTLCKTCSEVVCPKCITLKHSKHEFSTLAALASQGGEDLLATAIRKAEALPVLPKLDEPITSLAAILADLKENKKEADKEIERIHRRLLAMVERRIKELHSLLDDAHFKKERLLQLARENAAGRGNDIADLKQLGGDLTTLSTEAEIASDAPPLVTKLNALGSASLSSFPSLTAELKILDANLAEAESILARVGSLSDGSKASRAPLSPPAAPAPAPAPAPQALPKARFDHLNESSKPSLVVGSQGSGNGQLNRPYGIAIDHARGTVMVAEYYNSRVSMFDHEGKFVKSFGKEGSGPGEFSSPRGIAFDPSSRTILVADHHNNRIQIFSEEGDYLSQFDTACYPCNVALDDAGRIYVALADSHQVQVFEPRGARHLFLWGKQGNGEGDLSDPRGIAVNGRGEVIVCDCGNSRLSVFTKEGKFLRTIGKGETSPFAICLDGEGNMLVTEFSRSIVHVFDPEGRKIKEFGQMAGMSYPCGIGVDKAGRIVLSDYQEFDEFHDVHDMCCPCRHLYHHILFF